VTSQWEAGDGQRPRRYYSITEAGRQVLAAFRDEWDQFSKTVGGVLHQRRADVADPGGEGPE
jgi:DNA-binding PadR family transcriptional regulator